jgi:UDP-N-acetyl-D-mannosaminuronic acid dehydrogenase
VRRVRDHVPSGEHRKIALLGASYKADVDDSRESPSEKLVALFEELDYETAVFDPIARGFKHGLSPSLEDAVDGADAVVLVVGHRVFQQLDPADIGPRMRSRLLVDARKFFDATKWSNAGFTIETLGNGRGRTKPVFAVNGRQ